MMPFVRGRHNGMVCGPAPSPPEFIPLPLSLMLKRRRQGGGDEFSTQKEAGLPIYLRWATYLAFFCKHATIMFLPRTHMRQASPLFGRSAVYPPPTPSETKTINTFSRESVSDLFALFWEIGSGISIGWRRTNYFRKKRWSGVCSQVGLIARRPVPGQCG